MHLLIALSEEEIKGFLHHPTVSVHGRTNVLFERAITHTRTRSPTPTHAHLPPHTRTSPPHTLDEAKVIYHGLSVLGNEEEPAQQHTRDKESNQLENPQIYYHYFIKIERY